MTQDIIDSRAADGSLNFPFNGVTIRAAVVSAQPDQQSSTSKSDNSDTLYYSLIGVAGVFVLILTGILYIRIKRAQREPKLVVHGDPDEWFAAATGSPASPPNDTFANVSHYYPVHSADSYLDIARNVHPSDRKTATLPPKTSLKRVVPTDDLNFSKPRIHFYPEAGGWNGAGAPSS
mmetsp:Transcript_1141/g.3240  ORF Transcript_1141/g.3240 Transcript_1141/m.3240 type:complete len:177 (+) Transcript_1141:222-752(+)